VVQPDPDETIDRPAVLKELVGRERRQVPDDFVREDQQGGEPIPE
jgi:hypothetical protein